MQRAARTKIHQEVPCRRVQWNDLDARCTALHQQMDGPSVHIEARQRLIVAGKHGPPNVIDRIVRPQEPHRRMRDKTDARLIIAVDGFKCRQVERLGVGRVKRAVDRPFEPRNVGQIRDKRREAGRRQ